MLTGAPKQPQRCCHNCGIQVRPENVFCTSCGATLASKIEGPDPMRSGTVPGWLSSFIISLQSTYREAKQRLRGDSLVPRGHGAFQGMFRFKDLPLTKAVLVGLVLLVLLVLLSPLALFATLLAFGVSVIALIVRAWQRRSTGRLPVVGVASLVLVFVFAGISNALYGTEFLGSIDSSLGKATMNGEAPTAVDATSTVQEECGIPGCPDENGERIDKPPASAGDEARSVEEDYSSGFVHVFSVENAQVLKDGHLLVSSIDQHFYAYDSRGYMYLDGVVGSEGGLFVSDASLRAGYTGVGNLAYLKQECDFSAAQARSEGLPNAMQKECGFRLGRASG